MIPDICHWLSNEISKNYIGKRDDINALIIALLTGGHVLIEGMPGLAKTTLANALAQAVDADFKRIQFTSDLMPADITGSSIYNIHNGEFKFIEGPIFTHILMADEINRAPARTQSALLESMQEKHVTVDGKTYDLPGMFFVIATQNGEDERGTFPLPQSQLDRFMFRIRLDYPSASEEEQILFNASRHAPGISAVMNPDDLDSIRAKINDIHVSQAIIQYISGIIRATREHRKIQSGASPRAGVMMLNAARGNAFRCRREYVTPDDVMKITPYTLNHRLVLQPGETSVDNVISELLHTIPFK